MKTTMKTTDFYQATFTTSAHTYAQLPADENQEIAFIGRSNVGKSSIINALTNKKNLAHTSKMPGKTQLINFFSIQSSLYFVDLPGYGYAQVSDKLKLHWHKTINQYICERHSLLGLVVIVDIRRGLSHDDIEIIKWCAATQKPVTVVLNKTDKLSKNHINQAYFEAKKCLNAIYQNDNYEIVCTSTTHKNGVEELSKTIIRWLE